MGFLVHGQCMDGRPTFLMHAPHTNLVQILTNSMWLNYITNAFAERSIGNRAGTDKVVRHGGGSNIVASAGFAMMI